MFTTRLISGIVLVILAIFFVGKGGALLFAVTALISLVGLFEPRSRDRKKISSCSWLSDSCLLLWDLMV